MRDLTDQLLAVRVRATLFDATQLAQLGRKIAFAHTLTEAKTIEFMGLPTAEPILPAITIADWLLPEYEHMRQLVAVGTPQVPPNALLPHPRYVPAIPRSSPSVPSLAGMDVADTDSLPVAYDPAVEWAEQEMVPVDLLEDHWRVVHQSSTPDSLRSGPTSSRCFTHPVPPVQSSPHSHLAASAMGSPSPTSASEAHARLVDGYERAVQSMVALAHATLEPCGPMMTRCTVHVALEEGQILDDEEEDRLGNIMANVKSAVAGELFAEW